jgi:hypothetical protein
MVLLDPLVPLALLGHKEMLVQLVRAARLGRWVGLTTWMVEILQVFTAGFFL